MPEQVRQALPLFEDLSFFQLDLIIETNERQGLLLKMFLLGCCYNLSKVFKTEH